MNHVSAGSGHLFGSYVGLSSGAFQSSSFFTQGVSATGYVSGVSALGGFSGRHFVSPGSFSYHNAAFGDHYSHGYYGHGYGYGYGHHDHHGHHGFGFGFGFGGGYGFFGGYYGYGYGHGYGYGFGYYYSPYYGYDSYYPYYRTYSYYPYSYYSTIDYYPAYEVVYHSDYAVVDYADETDPYVEYVDSPSEEGVSTEAPSSGESFDKTLPDGFLTPFVSDYPSGLSPEESLAKGQGWLKAGDYALAAEAFRQVWLARPGDYYPPFQLALALFGLGRYGLGGRALEAGLARNSAWVSRRFLVTESFPSLEEFGSLLKELQRHALRFSDDGEARFLLGYLYLFSGHEYEANSTFAELQREKWSSPYLAAFVNESATRLFETKKKAPPSKRGR